jgi:hypothetical protein
VIHRNPQHSKTLSESIRRSFRKQISTTHGAGAKRRPILSCFIYWRPDRVDPRIEHLFCLSGCLSEAFSISAVKVQSPLQFHLP